MGIILFRISYSWLSTLGGGAVCSIYVRSNKGFNFGQDPPSDELFKKIQDLYTTDDGEPSEESHGASYETQLALELDLSVSLDLVVGCRVEENVDKLKG